MQEQYIAFDLSDSYPLPEELPLHHPLLQSLVGRYPVQDTLPPWWADFVKQAPEMMQSLFGSLSIREFREGCIEEKRWRKWKQSQSGQDDLPKSPKLKPLISMYPWDAWFEDRGDKDTPEDLDLVISTSPEYFLNMSNGDGWGSCQHLYDGGENECLPGNWYDTGVAVAMLLPREKDIWEGSARRREGVVIARTTVRVLFTDDGLPMIVLSHCYHNNATSMLHLLSLMIQRCEEHDMSWGIMSSYFLQCLMNEGMMGACYRERQRDVLTLQGPSFWLPDGYNYPYIDGRYTWDMLEEPAWHKLEAEVIRYTPHPLSPE